MKTKYVKRGEYYLEADGERVAARIPHFIEKHKLPVNGQVALERGDGYVFVFTTKNHQMILMAGCRSFRSIAVARGHLDRRWGDTALGRETRAILYYLVVVAHARGLRWSSYRRDLVAARKGL